MASPASARPISRMLSTLPMNFRRMSFKYFQTSTATRPDEPQTTTRSHSVREHEHFFKYTAGRWLYNEEYQTSRRYVEFNVDALKELACRTVGANTCVSIEKLDEGAHNRIFLLAFDTGLKVIARIPFSTAGPPHLTTASEVATMDYARTVMSLPVPKVLAYSSLASSTPVGCEFIIMEYVEGILLGDRTSVYDDDELGPCAEAVARMFQRFCTVRFSQIGSLYYKEDVSEELQARPLYSKGSSHGLGGEDRFRIGPSVRREFWRGKRADLTVDRGPWKNFKSYATALARCQQAWLRTHAIPRPAGHPFRRADVEESPEAICQLLDKYIELLPYLLPDEQPLRAPVLWHPDLSGSNIIISKNVYGEERHRKIVGFIDWQSASCAPLILQAYFPPAFAYGGSGFNLPEGIALPELPPQYDDLDPEAQDACQREWKQAVLHKWLEMETTHNHLFQTALAHPLKVYIDTLVYPTANTWSRGSVWFAQAVRNLEINARDKFPDRDLPTVIPDDDLPRHRAEFDRQGLNLWNRNLLEGQLDIQGDGWVENEAYENVRARLATIRESDWPASAEAKIGPWPFRDGAPPMDE